MSEPVEFKTSIGTITHADGRVIMQGRPKLVSAADHASIVIVADDGRRLLTVDRQDGRLVATYDPADLDEAARIFVERVSTLLCPAVVQAFVTDAA